MKKFGFSPKTVADMIENTGWAGVGGWRFVVRVFFGHEKAEKVVIVLNIRLQMDGISGKSATSWKEENMRLFGGKGNDIYQ